MKNLLFYFLCSQFLICQIPQDKKIISSLYVYDLDSRKSSLLFKEERHFEAPNWSKDGNYLYINSQGKLEKYDLKGNNLGVINTGNLDKLNNDHGISFDGKFLFFSSGKNEIQGHSSYIYSIPLAGGSPKLLTKFSPSYWHGVSADGKYIVYCAERDGNYDVYKLNSEGGVEVRLTFDDGLDDGPEYSPDGKYIIYCAERDGNYDVYKLNSEGGVEVRLTFDDGLDDGPEYSPDGKYIYFNSYRSGKMQIWRMNSKGSDAEQITFDKYSNWFPHISPKNDLAVIISYIEDQKQLHPFGKNVKLRLINLNTKKVTDLTDIFYGGQGTINVNSWNPDGTKFSYVKYSLEDL
jgi:Tol biopolymer transport system component